MNKIPINQSTENLLPNFDLESAIDLFVGHSNHIH